MSLMRKSEVTKSAKRSIHNSSVEVYHHTSGERDMQIFKNKLVDDAFWRLANYGPAFSAVPDDISFLKEPCDFYQSLLVCLNLFAILLFFVHSVRGSFFYYVNKILPLSTLFIIIILLSFNNRLAFLVHVPGLFSLLFTLAQRSSSKTW
jgi:hypothetical protein